MFDTYFVPKTQLENIFFCDLERRLKVGFFVIMQICVNRSKSSPSLEPMSTAKAVDPHGQPKALARECSYSRIDSSGDSVITES